MEFEEFFAATKTSILDPTGIPTVVPDIPVVQHVGVTGERTFWTVFVLMTIAFLSFSVISWTVPPSKRLLNSLTATIVLIAGLSYFAMATGGGWVWHHSKIVHKHDHGIPDTYTDVRRPVFWVRYLDWLLTTPLLLIDLSLLAGLSGASIFSLVVADLVMIVGGVVASLSWEPRVQWGWFAIACIAYLWIMYALIAGVSTARARGGATLSKFYTYLTAFTLILWTAYPIVWGIASNPKKISVDAEIVVFAVLDVLAKGVFGAWLLFTHHRQSETNVVVDGFWAHGLQTEGLIRVGDEEEGA